MLNRIDIANFNLIDYNYNEIQNEVPFIIEELNLKLPKLTRKMYSRMILSLNLMTKFYFSIQNLCERKTNIEIKRTFACNDTILYKIPKNISCNKLPENVELKTKYGIYKNKLEKKGGDIFYIRYIKLNKGEYPASEYPLFINFFRKIMNADKQKIMLKSSM